MAGRCGSRFAVDDSLALAGLAFGHAVHVTPQPVRRLAVTYHDTADLDLARWGIALRHGPQGSGGAWVLDLPLGDGSRVLSEHAVALAGTAGEPPEAAADALAAVLRGRRPVPLVHLSMVRRRLLLRTADGGPLATVDDERVTARGQRVRVHRFREVVVGPADGAPAEPLREVERRVERAGGRRGSPASPLLRALGADPPPEPLPLVPPLDAGARVADLVRAVIALGARRLMGHDPGIRLDLDPEAVHEARVAARQLRSQLGAWAAFLEPGWVEAVRDDLRWLGRGLGGVRDHDVMAARLAAQSEGLAPEDRGDAVRLLARLGKERARLRGALLRQMRSPRYGTLVDGLVAAAAEPPVLEGDAPARAVVPAVGWHAWHRLARAVGAAVLDPGRGRLHRVRIRAKHARYVAEAAALLGGHAAGRLGRALAELQRRLGEVQDAGVAEAWLRRRARRGTQGEALVAGQLVARQRAAAEEARSAWRRDWEHAAARKPRRWTRAASQAAGAPESGSAHRAPAG